MSYCRLLRSQSRQSTQQYRQDTIFKCAINLKRNSPQEQVTDEMIICFYARYNETQTLLGDVRFSPKLDKDNNFRWTYTTSILADPELFSKKSSLSFHALFCKREGNSSRIFRQERGEVSSSGSISLKIP